MTPSLQAQGSGVRPHSRVWEGLEPGPLHLRAAGAVRLSASSGSGHAAQDAARHQPVRTLHAPQIPLRHARENFLSVQSRNINSCYQRSACRHPLQHPIARLSALSLETTPQARALHHLPQPQGPSMRERVPPCSWNGSAALLLRPRPPRGRGGGRRVKQQVELLRGRDGGGIC